MMGPIPPFVPDFASGLKSGDLKVYLDQYLLNRGSSWWQGIMTMHSLLWMLCRGSSVYIIKYHGGVNNGQALP
jgi:hypothetical protein